MKKRICCVTETIQMNVPKPFIVNLILMKYVSLHQMQAVAHLLH